VSGVFGTREDLWCQGYSEPEAGSDLASLRTSAERDGDEYVVNGSKIWTSAAEIATHIFALVRTDREAKPQKGISFLLIDMTTPGIEVRPLIAMNGRRLWNQVIFEDVRVPVANRLGAENEGWTVAKKLLGDERFMVSRIGESKRLLSVVREAASEERFGGGRLLEDPDFALRLADLERRLLSLETLGLRLLSQGDGGQDVGAEPSMLKLLGSPLVQGMDEALIEAVSYYAAPDAAPYFFGGANEAPPGPDYAVAAMSNYLHHRGFSIAGGTSEVQHGIIAKAVLGM
jgi:alkylation response protein AidB-like acyl-CoA dehydrogenase